MHERNCKSVTLGMSIVDARRINLNLVPALEALLETRSVSAAARRTHVSQSAMSHSLAKLRGVLGDPLLVPEGRALALTPRAAQLAETLPEALDRLVRTLAPPAAFLASETRRIFRIATLDYFEFAIIGDLLAYLSVHAPHAQVWVERVSALSLEPLVRGEIDVALVGETSLPRSAALRRAELFRDPFTVMMRRGHPAARTRRLSMERYLEYPHVVVTIEGRADGAVDRALEPHGRARQVVLRLPHFSTAPLAVLASDALCTIASTVGRRAAALYPIELRAPPIALPSAGVVAVWSKRAEADEAGRWLRGLFIDGKVMPKRTAATR